MRTTTAVDGPMSDHCPAYATSRTSLSAEHVVRDEKTVSLQMNSPASMPRNVIYGQKANVSRATRLTASHHPQTIAAQEQNPPKDIASHPQGTGHVAAGKRHGVRAVAGARPKATRGKAPTRPKHEAPSPSAPDPHQRRRTPPQLLSRASKTLEVKINCMGWCLWGFGVFLCVGAHGSTLTEGLLLKSRRPQKHPHTPPYATTHTTTSERTTPHQDHHPRTVSMSFGGAPRAQERHKGSGKRTKNFPVPRNP